MQYGEETSWAYPNHCFPTMLTQCGSSAFMEHPLELSDAPERVLFCQSNKPLLEPEKSGMVETLLGAHLSPYSGVLNSTIFGAQWVWVIPNAQWFCTGIFSLHIILLLFWPKMLFNVTFSSQTFYTSFHLPVDLPPFLNTQKWHVAIWLMEINGEFSSYLYKGLCYDQRSAADAMPGSPEQITNPYASTSHTWMEE